MWPIFKVFIESLTIFIASVLCFAFLAVRHCRILASRPGTAPTRPALGGEVNHWTTRDVLLPFFKFTKIKDFFLRKIFSYMDHS